MRVLLLVSVCLLCVLGGVKAIGFRNMEELQQLDTWTVAVNDAQTTLDQRNARLMRVSGELEAAREAERQKKLARQAAAQNVALQQVALTQAQTDFSKAARHFRRAQDRADTFRDGPLKQSETTFNDLETRKPKFDALQQQITQSQSSIQVLPKDTYDQLVKVMNAKQRHVNHFYTRYNAARLDYESKKAQYAAYLNELNAARANRQAKHQAYLAQKAATDTAVTNHNAKIAEHHLAKQQRQMLEQRFSAAKQDVMNALAALKAALEAKLKAYREQLSVAQLQEARAQNYVNTTDVARTTALNRKTRLQNEIAALNIKLNEASAAFAKASGEYHAALALYRTSRRATHKARKAAHQAHQDLKNFNAAIGSSTFSITAIPPPVVTTATGTAPPGTF